MNGNGNGSGSWFDYDKRLRPEMLKGKRHTVTIRAVGEITLDIKNKRKIVPVVFFEKTDKYLELNDTNRMTLVRLFGDQKQTCIGKPIDLQTEEVQGGRNGIVIYPASPAQPEPKPPAAALTESPAATDPFLEAAKRLQLSPEAIGEYLLRAGGDRSRAYDLLVSQFKL